jgi:hypothetical protein
MRAVAAALPKGAVPSGIAIAIAACTLTQIDAIAPLTSGGDATVEAGGNATAEAAGEGSDDKAADVSVDTARDALSDETSFDGPPSLPCSSSTPPLQEWTFDTTIQGWVMDLSPGVTATLTWTGSTGDPTSGALEVDFTPGPADAAAGNVVWLHEDMPASDLTDRSLSAWVWLDSGPSPQFLTYAQTGPDYEWADDGEHTVPSQTWTCLSLPVSKPAFNQPGYDTTQVVRIGLEMISYSPFRVFVDTVRY